MRLSVLVFCFVLLLNTSHGRQAVRSEAFEKLVNGMTFKKQMGDNNVHNVPGAAPMDAEIAPGYVQQIPGAPMVQSDDNVSGAPMDAELAPGYVQQVPGGGPLLKSD